MWQANRILHLASFKGFVPTPKVLAGAGHLKRTCKNEFHVTRAIQDMLIRDVGSRRRLPERGCLLERQICRFSGMILRDMCSTWHGLAPFSWRPQNCRQMEWQNGKMHLYKAVRLALHFLFLKEVLQNSFVFNLAGLMTNR